MEYPILMKLLALLSFAMFGAWLEACGLQVQVPDGCQRSRGPRVPATLAQRLAAGFLFGCIYAAFGCGFGACDVLTTEPGPPLTVALLVSALVSGFCGARFARLGVRVPIANILRAFLGGTPPKAS